MTDKKSDLLPSGSLSDCENVIISKKGELKGRRGFEKIISFEKNEVREENGDPTRSNLFLDAEEVLGVFAFLDQLLIWTVTGIWITKNLSQSVSSFVHSKKIADKIFKFPNDYLTLKNTFYFLDNQVLKKIIGHDENFYLEESCTLPQAYSPYSIEKIDDTLGVISAEGSAAYRICYKRIYSNGHSVSGAPSSRVEVFSDEIVEDQIDEKANARKYNIRLLFNCPVYLRDEDFVEIYGSRSPVVGTASDDMMLLFSERVGVLRNSYPDNQFQFVDRSDYRFIPRYLYTSPSQEGIQNQNDSLPLCRHISSYRNMLAFLSPRYYKELMITIKKPDFLVPGDFFTFEKQSQIFKIYAANSFNSDGFVVDRDHRITVRNFVNSINTSKNNTFVDAYDVSNGQTFAIMLRARVSDDEPIKVAFRSLLGQEEKALDPDLSSPVFMFEGDYFNRILFSKPFFYEEAPFHRFIEVGDPQRLIIAACESRGYFYVFKEDGLFRISGYDADNLSVELVDEDVRLVSKNAIISIDNIIYALTYRGLIRLSYDGVQVVSQAIEDDIKERMTWGNASLCKLVKNPLEDQILLLCFSDETLKSFDTVFVYHHLHSEWTKWSANIQGIVYHDVVRSLLPYNRGGIYTHNHSIDSYPYVDELSMYCSASTLLAQAFSKLDLHQNQKAQNFNVMDLVQLDSLFSRVDLPLFFFYTSKEDEGKEVLWNLEGNTKGIFLMLPNKDRNSHLFFSGLLAIAQLGGEPELTFVNKWNYEDFDYICEGSDFLGTAAKLKIQCNSQKYSWAFFDFPKQIFSKELISAFEKESHKLFLGRPLPRRIIFNNDYTDKPLVEKTFSQLKLFFSDGDNKKMAISFKTDQGVSEVYPVKTFPENKGYGEGKFSLDAYGGEVYGGSSSNIFLPREVRRGHYFSFSLFNNDFDGNLILSGSQLDFQS